MAHILNVRCCCRPQKILGTLEIDDLHLSFTVAIARPISTGPTWPREWVAFDYHRIELRHYQGFDEETEIAVYSDDRPIEFWRQLPNFREAA